MIPLLRSVLQSEQCALVIDALSDLDRMVFQRGDFSRLGQVEGKWVGQSGRFEEQGQHGDLLVECHVSTRMATTHQEGRANSNPLRLGDEGADAPGVQKQVQEQSHPFRRQGRLSTWRATRPRRQARLAPQQSSSLPA